LEQLQVKQGKNHLFFAIKKEKIEYGASKNKNNQVGKNLVVFV
jgi:hypothetical protein